MITEVDPLKALEAIMDGYHVMPMGEAIKKADILITVTGNCGVIRKEHFLGMKEGAIIANSGHFDVEIDVASLKKIAKSSRQIRPSLHEYSLKNGRKVYLLAEGRLVNLSAAEGHPAMVMDMSFANQALSAEYMAKEHESLGKKVYKVPEDIDKEVARLKLKSMGVDIDRLTKEQKTYLAAWTVGT